MTINELLIRTLRDEEVAVVEPGLYTGNASQYYLFRVDEIGDDFGDDTAGGILYLTTVYYVCPREYNSIHRRRLTRQRLHAAGFTWPDIVDATSETDAKGADSGRLWQRWVFECEISGGPDGEVEPDGEYVV